MERLSAVRAGTDADTLGVQDRRYIVRMGAGRGERQNWTGLFGIAEDGDVWNSRESSPRVATKRCLVGSDSRTPHALDIVEGGDKSYRFQNWRRPGLELVRRGSIFDVIAAEGCDHLAAAEHRWHAFEPAWLGIESPDTRRPIKLVTGERIEIDVERRNVDCVMYHGLGSICEHRNALLMGKPYNCLERSTHTENIRHVCYRHETLARRGIGKG